MNLKIFFRKLAYRYLEQCVRGIKDGKEIKDESRVVSLGNETYSQSRRDPPRCPGFYPLLQTEGPMNMPDPVFSLETDVETQSGVGVPCALNDDVPFGARVMLQSQVS